MGITDRWDSAKEQQLRELWAEGQSGSLIGAKLGVSRNAVIGKVHRLGLAKRSTEERNRNIRNTMRKYRVEQKPKTPKPKREKLNKLQFPVEPLPPRDPNERGLYRLVDLPDDGCKFPFGMDSLTFCGAKQAPGFVYCERHALRCYRAESPSFRAEHRPNTVFAAKKLSLVR